MDREKWNNVGWDALCTNKTNTLKLLQYKTIRKGTTWINETYVEKYN